LAHGSKDLDLFITISFVKGFLNGNFFNNMMHCMHHTYISNLFDSLERTKAMIGKIFVVVNNFNK